MLKTLLFDLDGTLLPVDTDLFVETYLKFLSKRMIKWMEPRDFINKLMSSTYAAINNLDPSKTNQEVFWENFSKTIPYDIKELMPVFDDFYEHEFPKLSYLIKKNDLPAAILETAYQKGYEMVIATSPIFPEKAIFERLNWINAKKFPYKLVTTYENMHFAKPHIEYYKEIIQIIGVKPEECMMIGNDVDEDMIAGSLGMKTFLVTDFILNRNNKPMKVDYSGSLKDLLEFVNNLKEVNKYERL